MKQNAIRFSGLSVSDKKEIIDLVEMDNPLGLFNTYEIGGAKFDNTDSTTAQSIISEFVYEIEGAYDEFNNVKSSYNIDYDTFEYYTGFHICNTPIDVHVIVTVSKYGNISIQPSIIESKSGKHIVKPTTKYDYSELNDMLYDIKGELYYVYDCEYCSMEIDVLLGDIHTLIESIYNITSMYEDTMMYNTEQILTEFLDGCYIENNNGVIKIFY